MFHRRRAGAAVVSTSLVILLGVALSLYQAAQIRDEYFFVGDGGLRALLSHQLAAGRFAFDLELPAEEWVRALWRDGLFPFQPPFVYDLGGRRFIVFPVLFAVVTAPFYALAGFRGLYAVPLLSLWFTWLRFAWVCRRVNLLPVATLGGLGALVLASPLTPYGAMYWEHTLAVALAFTGLTMILPLRGEVSHRGAVLGALLLSLSGMVREELFCLAAAAAGITLLSPHLLAARDTGLARHRRGVLIAFGAGAVVFLAANWLIYRRPLGTHSIPSLEDYPGGSRPAFAVFLLKTWTFDLAFFFPIAAFAFVVGLPGIARGRPLVWRSRLHLAAGAVFAVGVAVLSPSTGGRQWGPRLLLPLVPIAALLYAIGLEAVLSVRRRALRVVGVGAFATASCVGVWRNAVDGTTFIRREYAQRAEAFARFRALPVRTIVVSHQFTAQQLAGLFVQKRFFLAPSGRALRQVAAALAVQGESRFAYICDPVWDCGPVTEQTASVVIPQRPPPTLRLTRVASVDRYVLFEGEVLKAP